MQQHSRTRTHTHLPIAAYITILLSRRSRERWVVANAHTHTHTRSYNLPRARARTTIDSNEIPLSRVINIDYNGLYLRWPGYVSLSSSLSLSSSACVCVLVQPPALVAAFLPPPSLLPCTRPRQCSVLGGLRLIPACVTLSLSQLVLSLSTILGSLILLLHIHIIYTLSYTRAAAARELCVCVVLRNIILHVVPSSSCYRPSVAHPKSHNLIDSALWWRRERRVGWGSAV